jgi:hypothetical protein
VSSLASFQCQKNKEKGKAKESLPFAPFFHTVPRPNEHMFPFQCFEGLRFASNPKHEGAHLPFFVCLKVLSRFFGFPQNFDSHSQTQGYCRNVHRKPHLRHGSMNTSIGSASFGPRYDIRTHCSTQTLVIFLSSREHHIRTHNKYVDTRTQPLRSSCICEHLFPTAELTLCFRPIGLQDISKERECTCTNTRAARLFSASESGKKRLYTATHMHKAWLTGTECSHCLVLNVRPQVHQSIFPHTPAIDDERL